LHDAIENMLYLKIIPFEKEHLDTFSKLSLSSSHNATFDHSIIAQAITKKMFLVSSNKKIQSI
jgi:PIN domain nuclease of toxin-antitoxin system